MFSNIRQKISDLLTNQTSSSNPSDASAVPKTSLLAKIGGVFNNFSGTATPSENKILQDTVLRNVARQINLGNNEVNTRLPRKAVSPNFAAASSAMKSDGGSEFWMSGGYRNMPVQVSTDARSTQKAVLEGAYKEFGKLAGLSEAGTAEFAAERLKENGEQVFKRGETPTVYGDVEFAAQAGTGSFAIYATDGDIAKLNEIKTREQNAALGDAPPPVTEASSMSARNASTVEQITATITDTFDAVLGSNGNSIGGAFNRIGVSSLHVIGDAAEAMGAKDAAATLRNANSDLTKQEQVTKAAIQKSGYDVPTVAKIAQEAENTPEFLHDVVEGATLGDFSEKESYGAQLGKVVGGINPLGDVRDVVANTKNVAENKKGSTIGLTASIIGAIPVAGDLAKPIIKAEKEVITEVVEKALTTEGKEVAEKIAKAEAEKVAKAEAEKIAKEEAERVAKEQAEKISKRYDELAAQGHGPARHGEAVTETQLDDRAMYGKDPITGTTDDAFRKDASGNPLPHKYSKDATQFRSKEAFVKTEEHLKNSQDYKDALNQALVNNRGDFVIRGINLEDIHGTNYKDAVFGKTRVGSKNHPTGTVETDFTDATVKAIFVKDANGQWNLETMYPEPK